MAHELCHDESSLTQGHTPDFYREYHDMHLHVVNAAEHVFLHMSKPKEQQRLIERAKKEKLAATKRRAAVRKAQEKAVKEAEKLAKKTPAKKKVAARQPKVLGPRMKRSRK